MKLVVRNMEFYCLKVLNHKDLRLNSMTIIIVLWQSYTCLFVYMAIGIIALFYEGHHTRFVKLFSTVRKGR